MALKSPALKRSKPKNNNSSQKIEIDLVLLYWMMIAIIIVENLMIDQEIQITNPKIAQEILTNLKIVQEILTIPRIVQEIPTNHMIEIIMIVIIAITTIVIEMIEECIHPEKKIIDPDQFQTNNSNRDQMILADHLGTSQIIGHPDVMIRIGKKHALKIYDLFALNTSYFWGKHRIKYYSSFKLCN